MRRNLTMSILCLVSLMLSLQADEPKYKPIDKETITQGVARCARSPWAFLSGPFRAENQKDPET